MAKVAILFFSCNRLEYLMPMLESFHKQLDFSGLSVYKILMDDYPKGRDDGVFEEIRERYAIDRLILNEENLGLSVAWKKIWSYVPEDIDYIWHQEDDFLFLRPLRVRDLIPILEESPVPLTQIVLKRQQWYRGESDFIHKIESGEVGREVTFTPRDGQEVTVVVHQFYFNANPCFYPRWVIEEEYPFMPQESVIISHLVSLYPEYHSAFLGHAKDPAWVEHIGEYNQGKKVLEGEPGWSWLKNYDPEKRYYSRLYLTEYKG